MNIFLLYLLLLFFLIFENQYMDSSPPFTPPYSSYTGFTIPPPRTPTKVNKKRQIHEVIETSQMVSLSSDDTPSPQPALKKNKQIEIYFIDEIIRGLNDFDPKNHPNSKR